MPARIKSIKNGYEAQRSTKSAPKIARCGLPQIPTSPNEIPTSFSNWIIIPAFVSSIKRHMYAVTTGGVNHGRTTSTRIKPMYLRSLLRSIAAPKPRSICDVRPNAAKTKVFFSAVINVGSANKFLKFSKPMRVESGPSNNFVRVKAKKTPRYKG